MHKFFSTLAAQEYFDKHYLMFEEDFIHHVLSG